jgi:hypothetical protein
MENKYADILRRGLPGGPNEVFSYVTGVFSTDGYRSDSQDVNNPFNIIPSGNITMKERDGTPLRKGPLLGIDNLGNEQMMYPGMDYQFPGNEVTEWPMAQDGLEYEDLELTDEEIKELRKGGYVVEELPMAQTGEEIDLINPWSGSSSWGNLKVKGLGDFSNVINPDGTPVKRSEMEIAQELASEAVEKEKEENLLYNVGIQNNIDQETYMPKSDETGKNFQYDIGAAKMDAIGGPEFLKTHDETDFKNQQQHSISASKVIDKHIGWGDGYIKLDYQLDNGDYSELSERQKDLFTDLSGFVDVDNDDPSKMLNIEDIKHEMIDVMPEAYYQSMKKNLSPEAFNKWYKEQLDNAEYKFLDNVKTHLSGLTDKESNWQSKEEKDAEWKAYNAMSHWDKMRVNANYAIDHPIHTAASAIFDNVVNLFSDNDLGASNYIKDDIYGTNETGETVLRPNSSWGFTKDNWFDNYFNPVRPFVDGVQGLTNLASGDGSWDDVGDVGLAALEVLPFTRAPQAISKGLTKTAKNIASRFTKSSDNLRIPATWYDDAARTADDVSVNTKRLQSENVPAVTEPNLPTQVPARPLVRQEPNPAETFNYNRESKTKPVNSPEINGPIGPQDIKDQFMNNWLDTWSHNMPFNKDKMIDRVMKNTYGNDFPTIDEFAERMNRLPIIERAVEVAKYFNKMHEALRIETNGFKGWTPKEITKRPKREIKNVSGFTKEELLGDNTIIKDKDKVIKLSQEDFQQSIVTPAGDIIPYKKPKNMWPTDFTPMSIEDYVNKFNDNIHVLNDIIKKNNKSDAVYEAVKLYRSGRLVFNTPPGQKTKDMKFIPSGTSSFGTKITPGKWTGEVTDDMISSPRDIPGLEMSVTSQGVFPGAPRRGSKSYESINEYLKFLDLGRVKPGFNSQTTSSRGLWEDMIKKGKAIGFYANPNVVYGTMKNEGGEIGDVVDKATMERLKAQGYTFEEI